VAAATHTGPVTRRITQSFHGFDMPDVIVIPSGDTEERRGELRGWALDDETGEWWGLCQYRAEPGRRVLDWFHETQLRRDGDLTDDDGLVAPGRVVALPQRDT
jgi:hypothetical protein